MGGLINHDDPSEPQSASPIDDPPKDDALDFLMKDYLLCHLLKVKAESNINKFYSIELPSPPLASSDAAVTSTEDKLIESVMAVLFPVRCQTMFDTSNYN